MISSNLKILENEALQNHEISLRSYNVCMRNGLDTITKLLDYYQKKKSFEGLNNCGIKSNKELIYLCDKYLRTKSDVAIESPNINRFEIIILNLTRTQREIINSFILINKEDLSVRSKNAISKLLDNNFSVRNFAEKIFLNKNFILSKIKNIGASSIPELEVYLSSVKEFIEDVSNIFEQEKLISLKNRFLIQRTFNLIEIPCDVLESESIFQLTDFLFKNNVIFNENHNSIIQKALKIYQNNNEYTIEEIALENNLSKERVRQIRKDSINELFNKLSFIKSFNDDLFQNYSIDLSVNLIEVTDDLISSINEQNKTSFTKEFISYILAVYLSDIFLVVGNIVDVLQPKFFNSRNRHNWNNIYIVNRAFSKVDFISFANDVSERLNERIEETYSFNFKSYLSRFINDFDIETIELALPIAEKIMNDEFGLYLDLYDNIIFKRNTIKQAFEYSYEALEILGKPSKIEEITKKILELHPNYETDENKVRTSMKRKDGFVPVGRKSEFGLKKWENELEDFKGGTIRSISIEFLEQYDNPKHISEITEYVLKYRPNSYEKSIYYNLRIDESNTFRFFKNSYVGLKNKKYSEEFEILKDSDIIERGSWEERYEVLLNFLLLENRLPFSNGILEEESRLYRWLAVQKGKLKTKKLDSQKEKLIIEIYEKFPQINSRRKLTHRDI